MFKVFLMTLLFPLIVTAQNPDLNSEQKKEQEIMDSLKKTTDVYSKEKGFYSKFRRVQTLALLGETDTAKGELFYSNKRLRLDLKGNDKSMVLITPEVIWNVVYDGDDISSIVKGKPVSNPLLNLLFGDKSNWDNFKVEQIHLNGDRNIDVTLVPKDKKKISYVARVRFKLDKVKNVVKNLTYWDDIDNETQLSFTYNRFKDKIDEAKFKYTPPKGAQVSEL